MAATEPIAKLRVSRDIIDAATAIYPRVLSTIRTGRICPICEECCCQHETVELTVLGETHEKLDTSLVLRPQEYEDAQEDARIVVESGIYPAFHWAQQQPCDALPPTDFNIPHDFVTPMSPTTDDNNLQLGAEASNLLPLEASPVLPPAVVTAKSGNQPVPKGRRKQRAAQCKFCASNGETIEFYTGHRMAEHGRVTCPILRSFICPLCQATGDNAHTLKYCPTGMGPNRIYSRVRNAFGKLQTLKY